MIMSVGFGVHCYICTLDFENLTFRWIFPSDIEILKDIVLLNYRIIVKSQN